MLSDYAIFAVFLVLVLLDVAGNTLVILVVHKFRAMKTPMNYLLLNLAVADILVGVLFAPRFFFKPGLFAHPSGREGDALCRAITGMDAGWMASLASGFLLIVVAVERFYAVVHPISFQRKITKRKIKRLVPACWITAALFSTPALAHDSYNEKLGDCRTAFAHYWQYVSYWLFLLIFGGFLPVGSMAGLYGRVIHSLWLRKKEDNTTTAKGRALITARKKITTKCVTVSVLYALCVFPIYIVYFASIFYPNVFVYGDLSFSIVYCLVVLNSTLNPFVYTLQCRSFRRHLKRLVGWSRWAVKSHPHRNIQEIFSFPPIRTPMSPVVHVITRNEAIFRKIVLLTVLCSVRNIIQSRIHYLSRHRTGNFHLFQREKRV